MAIVVTNAGFNGGTGPVVITLATNVVAGDILWGACAQNSASSRTVVSASTVDGQSFVMLNGATQFYGDPSATNGMRAFYMVYAGAGLTSGVSTVQINFSGAVSSSGCSLFKITGLSATPLDLGAAASFTTLNNTASLPITTDALAVDDEIALIAVQQNTNAALTTSGWTQYSNLYNTSSQRFTLAYQIQTGGAGGTVSVTPAPASGAPDMAAVYTTLMPAGAAPTLLGGGGMLLGMVG